MSSKNKIKFFKKIGFRITLWYSLSVVIIITIVCLLLYYVLQYEINKEIDKLLIDQITDMLPRTDELDLEDLETAIKRETSDRKLNKISARLLDINNNTLVTSHNFFDPPLQLPEKVTINKKSEKATFNNIRIKNTNNYYRLLTKPIFIKGSLKYFIQVAIFREGAYKARENFTKDIFILMPGVVIITIIGGYVISRKSLVPLVHIIKSTKTITASSLNTRLESLATGDEFEELTNTINLMLNRLEDSFKMIVRFTSDISHELRTPIATLKTGTEVFLARDRKTSEYRELLENNLNEFEKITRLIEDLLVILRADSGIECLNIKFFSLSNILKELGNTFKLIAESKNINFVINKMSDVQIAGDEVFLRRVFLNLFDNAIKYTQTKGHISVVLKEIGDSISVIIKDTGIGISEEDKEKIFNRFYRSDFSRSKETGGFGLGLSICKHIVELHHGKIKANSVLGIGSSFEVILKKNMFS